MPGIQTAVRMNKRPLERLRRVVDKIITPALERAARDGAEIAKDSIRNSPTGSGRYYFSPRTRRIQEASFPGKPPRPDSNEIIRKLKWKKVNDREYVIESGAAYSAALEFGEGVNLRGQPLEARPYMLPMVAALRKKYPKIIKTTVNEAVIRKLIR